MPVTRRAIETVHVAVNQSIQYMTDEQQYGVLDRWVTAPASGLGDCEDYALTKRARLQALGAGPHRV
jgi:predicted transglutaminase-like cysteine proteinase